MNKFWKALSDEEKNAMNNAANIGLVIGENGKNKKLDSGKYIPGYICKDKYIFNDKLLKKGKCEYIEENSIDYFKSIFDNLVNNNQLLAIKIYEFLIDKGTANSLFSLYFFHMSAMKVYKKLRNEEKAKKAAEENLKIAIKLKKEILNSKIKKNPCYDYLKRKDPNNKFVEKVEKIGFNFA